VWLIEDVVRCCVDEAGDEEGSIYFEVGCWEEAGWKKASGEQVGVGGECFVKHLVPSASVGSFFFFFFFFFFSNCWEWKNRCCRLERTPSNFEPCKHRVGNRIRGQSLGS
jgi:hypothetical protein